MGLIRFKRMASPLMNMIYNSPNYCVVEFAGLAGGVGFEIMDKSTQREIFLAGTLADGFRKDVARLIADEPSAEEIDDFLSQFDGLMQQPMNMH
jgi:hypothetical protein